MCVFIIKVTKKFSKWKQAHVGIWNPHKPAKQDGNDTTTVTPSLHCIMMCVFILLYIFYCWGSSAIKVMSIILHSWTSWLYSWLNVTSDVTWISRARAQHPHIEPPSMTPVDQLLPRFPLHQKQFPGWTKLLEKKVHRNRLYFASPPNYMMSKSFPTPTNFCMLIEIQFQCLHCSEQHCKWIFVKQKQVNT